MQVTETQNKGLIREFDVTIPYTNIEDGIADELNKLQPTVSIPGFRKGKAPLKILRTKYEHEVISNVVEKLVAKTIDDICKDRKIKPALQPKLDFENFIKGKDLNFKAHIEIFPEFENIDFSKISIDRYKVEVSDKELENIINDIRKNHREFIPVESKSHKLKEGEIAVIDFVGKIDGVEFEGGKGSNHELEIGSKSFIEGFESQLIGLKKGDTKTVKVTFPEGYHAKDLAGKPAEFDVTINEIKVPGDLPELNDEFPKKVGLNAKDLEEFKSKIKLAKENDLKSSSYNFSKKDLFDKLMNKLDQDVPPTLLEQELQNIKSMKVDESEEELNKLARRRVLLSLLFIKIADDNHINVSQQDVRNGIFDQARKYPGMEMQIIDLYSKNQYLVNEIKNSLLEDKVVDYVMKQVQINEMPISMDEFLVKL
ncbi:MAG: trigger factor [Sphingobacteriia bacterium]|nr:trigger factor [Sphingobacteriia bacterium]